MDSDQEIGKPDDRDAAPSSSSTRKILVKIKRHSKPPEDGEKSPEIGRTHHCRECNKSFGSGKALGGHMSSAHVQANKDYSYSYKNHLIKSKHAAAGLLHACGVCGKNFPSQKSLYGHMRCHPDRDWRGMEPPSAHHSSEASTEYSDDGDEAAVSFVGSLKAWTVKAKRGRSATKSSSEDEEDIAAGHLLLRLLKRLPDDKEVAVSDVPLGDDEVNIKKRKAGETLALHEPTTEEEGNQLEIEGKRQRASSSRPPKMKIWNTEDEEGKEGKLESEAEADLILGAICILANGKKENITGTNNCLPRPVATSTPEEKHVCSICNKVLHSHQALGGHKSSHNKFKMNIINTEDDDTANDSIMIRDAKPKPKPKGEITGTSSTVVGGAIHVSDQQQQPPAGDDNNNNTHVCQICKRGFPTGRALGGHRKIHNNNKGGNMNAGDDDGSKGGEEKAATSVRDFDLNMVPDDENGADADGDGDASDHML